MFLSVYQHESIQLGASTLGCNNLALGAISARRPSWPSEWFGVIRLREKIRPESFRPLWNMTWYQQLLMISLYSFQDGNLNEFKQLHIATCLSCSLPLLWSWLIAVCAGDNLSFTTLPPRNPRTMSLQCLGCAVVQCQTAPGTGFHWVFDELLPDLPGRTELFELFDRSMTDFKHLKKSWFTRMVRALLNTRSMIDPSLCLWDFPAKSHVWRSWSRNPSSTDIHIHKNPQPQPKFSTVAILGTDAYWRYLPFFWSQCKGTKPKMYGLIL